MEQPSLLLLDAGNLVMSMPVQSSSEQYCTVGGSLSDGLPASGTNRSLATGQTRSEFIEVSKSLGSRRKTTYKEAVRKRRATLDAVSRIT